MPSLRGERRWRNGGTRATARPRIPSNSSPVVQRLALGRRECLSLGQDTVPVLRTCAAHRGVRRTGASGRPRDACRSVRSARPRLRARHGTRAPRSAAAAGAQPIAGATPACGTRPLGAGLQSSGGGRSSGSSAAHTDAAAAGRHSRWWTGTMSPTTASTAAGPTACCVFWEKTFFFFQNCSEKTRIGPEFARGESQLDFARAG
jgi:hypothetical protein